MVPEAGHRFGPYELLAKLGSGGMGVVFRAWDERLHREIAIKLLHDEYETPGMRDRFLLEARAASALTHPNICTIFDIGEQEGEPYLVMELLEGLTLKEKIAAGALPAEEIVRIAAEVADGLAMAHSKGIIHRDIKPANIFLMNKAGGKSQVKVLDFGLAKISQGSKMGRASLAIEITSIGSTVGTLAYMSPEQARGETLDARSDLFSLGVVMYEMATRRVPFRGSTSALMYMQLLSQAPDPIRQWNDTVPRDLERLILRLLAKDRGERFGSAHDVHEALHRLAMKDDGAWLKKVPRPAVPLVHAPDPVVRLNRVRKRGNEGSEPQATAVDWGSSESARREVADEHVLRPRRMPFKESGPRESAFLPGATGKGPSSAGHLVPKEEPTNAAENAIASAPGNLPGARSEPAELDGSAGAEQAGLPFAATSAEQASLPPFGEAAELQAVRPPSAERAPLADSEADAPGAHSAATAEGNFAQENGAAAHVGVEEKALPATASAELALAAALTGESEPAAAEGEPETMARTHPDQIPAQAEPEPLIVDVLALADGSESGPAHQAARPTSGVLHEVRVTDRANDSRSRGRAVSPVAVPVARPKKAIGRSVWLAAALLSVVALGLLFWARGGGLGRLVLAPTDTVLLTDVQNRTGDPALDGAVTEALELELAQSSLNWRGISAFRAGANQVTRVDHVDPKLVTAKMVAQRLGSRAYVFGEMAGSRAPYRISLEVLDTRSNDKLASLEETAASKGEIGPAIDRLATELRTRLGEDSQSLKSRNLPLEAQGTADLEALSQYAQGEEARENGDSAGAVTFYAHALSEAPSFTLAAVKLAWVAAENGAELEAADAARKANAVSARGSARTRLMAETTSEALEARDYEKAAVSVRRLLAMQDKDIEGMVMLSEVMTLGGHMTEALLSAEGAYRLDATNAEAYRLAERAMIGLDRPEQAIALAETAAQAGVSARDSLGAARYLRGGARSAGPNESGGAASAVEMTDRAAELDESGRVDEGTEAWRGAARAMRGKEGLASAASSMIATGTLNRAMLGRCKQASSLAAEAATLPAGRRAEFRLGLAEALCGERDKAAARLSRIERVAGVHGEAAEVFAPVLRAAVAMAGKDPLRAQQALSGVHQRRDESPLTGYLLGLMHESTHHDDLATEDFASILRVRGTSFLTGTPVYPLAELNQGRVAAAMKTGLASRAAYARFVVLWAGADPGDPLLKEARAKAK